MAHPYHHALSSAKKWGGEPEDYQIIHDWFDETKKLLADFRHRALRHHAEGIFMCETIFGTTITLNICTHCGKKQHPPKDHLYKRKQIPTRWIGEQHVSEDLGFIPTAADWLKAIEYAPWMNRSRPLSKEVA